ncbi:hypothetical protein V6N11_081522 [Hibiscus sabdariffa]|uniref:Uncharacterized protein n=1 Tax=Hibiscus sabdariffa TaxID=183260 RepID=A0ABR2AAJ1_9ROSI
MPEDASAKSVSSIVVGPQPQSKGKSDGGDWVGLRESERVKGREEMKGVLVYILCGESCVLRLIFLKGMFSSLQSLMEKVVMRIQCPGKLISSFNKDPDVCEEGGLHPRALEDVRDMGLGTDVGDLVERVPSVENGSSCAARVDSLNNPKPSLKVCVIFI